MNAFITSPPGGILEASTACRPRSSSGPTARARLRRAHLGGILVLLMFLITMNAIAIFLRQRLERTW
jgi:phosphate transport system permease protein